MTSKFRILIIGNRPLFVKGFSQMLGRVGELVGQLATADLPLQPANDANAPQVIFFASPAGSDDVPETITRLQGLYPAVPIILTSFENDIKQIVTAIQADIRGMVQPAIEYNDLALAVNTVAPGNGYFFDLAGERLVYTDAADIRNPQKLQAVQNLSPAAKTFYQLLCTGLSYEEIATAMQVTVPVVMEHKARLSAVLQIKSRVGMVLYAVRNGL